MLSSLAVMSALHSASIRRRSVTSSSQFDITSALVITGRRARSASVKESASTLLNRSACQGDLVLANTNVSRKAHSAQP